ncbi:MAG: PD-(D/E)XK nuclease family protein, partial [Gammaproteobacteria bacterium]|nr:PD-(D/E)XK nuclease family protein [Gammaproteobacteria bacterium]
GGKATGSSSGTVSVDPALAQRIETVPRFLIIAPSRLAFASEHTHTDADGRECGIALHLMLDHLTRHPAVGIDGLYIDIANRLQRDEDDEELQAWWREACGLVTHPDLSFLFDESRYVQAYNEVPVQYLAQARMVYGVIDRLVITDDSVLVIDYKSHRTDNIQQLVVDYRAQLDCYAQAATRLWPARTVRAGLLFTACAKLAWMDAIQSRH